MKRKRRNDRENWLGCRMKNIICLRSFHLIFLISRTFSWSADERHLTQENKTNEDGPTSTLRCMPREKRKITCTNISCLRHWLITSATFWSCCPRSSHRSRRTWPKLWDLRDGRLSVFFKLPHVPPKKRLSRDVEPNKKFRTTWERCAASCTARCSTDGKHIFRFLKISTNAFENDLVLLWRG